MSAAGIETAAAGAQRRAADPGASAWVAASAGTGKTKVLTDRVVRLLLAGAAPERILCLTFTKAAAAEMATRIAGRLSAWAVAPEPKLRQDLEALNARLPEQDTVIRARRLFARVLDCPGGIRIQTIHGFCQSLLQRFPLESGLSPHFHVLDEQSAAERLRSAREHVLGRIRRGGGALAGAVAETGGLASGGRLGTCSQKQPPLT